MVAVRMVQVTVDQIIDVIAVRNRLVTATGPVDVARLVAGAAVFGRAAVRIALRNLDHMLIDMIAVGMVQVAVMQVIDVVTMADGGVAATGPMLVRVVCVMRVCASGHGGLHVL